MHTAHMTSQHLLKDWPRCPRAGSMARGPFPEGQGLGRPGGSSRGRQHSSERQASRLHLSHRRRRRRRKRRKRRRGRRRRKKKKERKNKQANKQTYRRASSNQLFQSLSLPSPPTVLAKTPVSRFSDQGLCWIRNQEDCHIFPRRALGARLSSATSTFEWGEKFFSQIECLYCRVQTDTHYWFTFGRRNAVTYAGDTAHDTARTL